jgi:hypothetical protein
MTETKQLAFDNSRDPTHEYAKICIVEPNFDDVKCVCLFPLNILPTASISRSQAQSKNPSSHDKRHHYANLGDAVDIVPEHYQSVDVQQQGAKSGKLEPQYSSTVHADDGYVDIGDII